MNQLKKYIIAALVAVGLLGATAGIANADIPIEPDTSEATEGPMEDI